MTPPAAGEGRNSTLVCTQWSDAPLISVPILPVPLLSSSNRRNPALFDESYLRELKKGDSAIQNHLFSYFSGRLHSKLRRQFRSPQLIEDACQETFLRVFSYFVSGNTLANPSGLPAFVYTTCHNVALEFLRAHTRQDQLPETFPEPAAAGPDPESQMVTGEIKVLIRRVLDELSARERQLLKRVFLDEEDKDVVCRELGVERNYLRVLLYRACRRFKEQAQRDGETVAGAS